jgi:hypothetical protein
MQEKVEHAVLALTAIISILISILDLFKVLDAVPAVAKGVPAITLLVLGLITGYLTLERRSKLDKIENLVVESTERVISSLNGVEVHRLGSNQEVYEYAAKQMRKAKKSVDDLTWGPAEHKKTSASQKAYEDYIETISSICSKKTIAYREVFSFSTNDFIERAERMLHKNLANYRLRYYQFHHRTTPPLLSFMIIDSQEVILAFYRAPFLGTEDEIQLAIRHPELVKLFQDYYNTIWQGANDLKAGDKSVLEKIKKQSAEYNS